MERRDPPPPDGAPAYMAQYTALMTILLAFFICMLTMGQQKASQYKKEGLGYIKNAFGAKGGLGIMPFWKTMMSGYPKVSADVEGKDSGIQAYTKGSFASGSFDADGILRTEVQDRGYSVRIMTPITFDGENLIINKEARMFLDRTGGVFSSMEDNVVTVACYESSGQPERDRMIAAKRAVILVRYLQERCNVPLDRVRGIGYAHSRYLGEMDVGTKSQSVMFFIRKKASKVKMS